MSELFSSPLCNDYPGPNFTLLIWYRTFAKYQTNIEVIHLITSFTSIGTQVQLLLLLGCLKQSDETPTGYVNSEE